ncbi:hypothetical protein BDQ94DRAFT_32334 [Aspergillus welwitschiae]|uniref:Uncharacterized protein n=1 Tax=Aspergillus welwitschiae TaxID=1341132 RepID=A0A3F3Q3D3_9EURO|nr:hypothetical protein BDQ94DRAFT_32334 [Aspergillus welwitschiae]RDH33688.1 hypothetical protein BDQ94DRAFT_32334 [Aspergillus welwitschiae]
MSTAHSYCCCNTDTSPIHNAGLHAQSNGPLGFKCDAYRCTHKYYRVASWPRAYAYAGLLLFRSCCTRQTAR